MENQNIGQYLRAKQASQYMGIGVSTLWLFTKQGKINAIRMSERVTVWDKNELNSFIASRSTAGVVNA